MHFVTVLRTPWIAVHSPSEAGMLLRLAGKGVLADGWVLGRTRCGSSVIYVFFVIYSTCEAGQAPQLQSLSN